MHYIPTRLSLLFSLLLFSFTAIAQGLQWTQDGNAYWVADKEGIAQVDFATKQRTIIVTSTQHPRRNSQTTADQVIQTFR
jgi:hypothetical protein